MNLTILGSTGAIGKNALSTINNIDKRVNIFALTAKSNIKLLYSQIKQFKPRYAVVLSSKDAEKLIIKCKKNNIKTKILSGKNNYCFVASHIKANYVLSAIVGAAALEPTYSAVKNGKTILLANKESLIMSGSLMMNEARKSKSLIIPVDSEHNAIFQILMSSGLEYNHLGISSSNNIKKIALTASGGPFLGFSKRKLSNVTPKEATRHPTWKMGEKISVDSASMINKGLEIIEAAILFRLKSSQIDVLLHPQSIVHGLVTFSDGSTISHMSNHDMRIPISYALSWPKRFKLKINPKVENILNNLTFKKIEPGNYKCLDLCVKSLEIGKNAPTILNAANEIAVDNFLQNKIKFVDIPVIIDKALKVMPIRKFNNIKSILKCDFETREYIKNYIEKKWK